MPLTIGGITLLYSQAPPVKNVTYPLPVRALLEPRIANSVPIHARKPKSAQLTVPSEPTRLPSCSLDARGNVYLSCLYTMSGAAHSTLLYLVDGSRLRSARPSILA